MSRVKEFQSYISLIQANTINFDLGTGGTFQSYISLIQAHCDEF